MVKSRKEENMQDRALESRTWNHWFNNSLSVSNTTEQAVRSHLHLCSAVLVMCRVQRSIFAVWQGWWRYNYNQRAGDSDALSGTEPHWGGAAGHDQWSGCWWWGNGTQNHKSRNFKLEKVSFLPKIKMVLVKHQNCRVRPYLFYLIFFN